MFCCFKKVKNLFCLIFVCFLLCENAKANDDFAYSDEWLAVGHYQSDLFGYESTIDTPNFFLSKNGKSNPKTELDATIVLFEGSDNQKKCLFPSRYMLLKKNNLIKTEFPKCDEYEQFYQDLRPKGATFLFTDAYMGSPASLFGHTLLRIDTSRKGTQMLAHGANYGAYMGENPGALYPLLGLFGGYYGGFTIKPYYDIINTYNNIENRDIWEFELNFTKDELDFLVAHLWEVGQAQSKYYFFERNCSYMLLEVLDAVKPSLKLAQKFPVQVIPLDTLKAVYNTPNLVKSYNYRPSRQKQIKARFAKMNKREQRSLADLLEQKNANDIENANVLETAYQYLQYQYIAKKIELKDYRKQSFAVLRARSKIKSDANSEVIPDEEPFMAHDSMRITMGVGVKNGDVFEEISYRPAYHSLSDDSYGFLRGAEINFLNTTIRHYDKDDKYVLQKFDLLGIRSIAPIDELFTPLSFQIMANVDREENRSGEEGYVANLIAGVGEAYALDNNIWVFAMANLRGAYGGFIPNNQWGGIGANIGILADWQKVRFLAETEKIWASNKFGNKIIYKFEGSFSLTRNWALAFDYKYEQKYGKDIDVSMIGLKHYF